jgi:hypothetical protein
MWSTPAKKGYLPYHMGSFLETINLFTANNMPASPETKTITIDAQQPCEGEALQSESATSQPNVNAKYRSIAKCHN